MNLLATTLLLADIVCGTWNLKWFPSGRADHRAPYSVERANIQSVAAVVKDGLAKTSGSGHVFFFQEILNGETLMALADAIGAPGLTNRCISAFRDQDNSLVGQQIGLLTDLPVVESYWAHSKKAGRRYVPRGYTYMLLDGGVDGLIACYGVHLKSNYGAVHERDRLNNLEKRAASAEQLVSIVDKMRRRRGAPVSRFVVAGDFNADYASMPFIDEKTFKIFSAAGFHNAFEKTPVLERITHPGGGRYPDATFDYILYSGFPGLGKVFVAPKIPVSDHCMVWAELRSAP